MHATRTSFAYRSRDVWRARRDERGGEREERTRRRRKERASILGVALTSAVGRGGGDGAPAEERGSSRVDSRRPTADDGRTDGRTNGRTDGRTRGATKRRCGRARARAHARARARADRRERRPRDEAAERARAHSDDAHSRRLRTTTGLSLVTVGVASPVLVRFSQERFSEGKRSKRMTRAMMSRAAFAVTSAVRAHHRTHHQSAPSPPPPPR